MIRVFAHEKLTGNTVHHQKFPRRLERPVARQAGQGQGGVEFRLRSARTHTVIRVAPVENSSHGLGRHVLELSEFIRRGAVHVQPAFFVADAIEDSSSPGTAALVEHAKLSATEWNILELHGRVVNAAGVILRAPLALGQVAIEQRLGLFDARQRQVMRLDLIAVILHHHQIEARGMEHTHHHDGQQGEAPENSDQHGAFVISVPASNSWIRGEKWKPRMNPARRSRRRRERPVQPQRREGRRGFTAADLCALRVSAVHPGGPK